MCSCCFLREGNVGTDEPNPVVMVPFDLGELNNRLEKAKTVFENKSLAEQDEKWVDLHPRQQHPQVLCGLMTTGAHDVVLS